MRTYKVLLNGKELSVQPARVSAGPLNRVWDGVQRPIEQSEEAYFVSFDLADRAELAIEVSEEFDRFEIRPLSRDLGARREGRHILLSVDRPMQFTVEIDGSHHALHVFANPPAERPQGDVIYFGPGEHRADLIWLTSGQTLYIDEGAVVYGVVYAKDAEHVRVMGRGVLDASPYRRGNDDAAGGREVIDALLARGFTPVDMKYHGNLVLHHCKNCLIEGVVLRDAPMWSTILRNDCQSITVDNVKIVGQWRYNSDGINICTSKNVTVQNCFVRSFDDCIITRGAYLEGETGNVENVTVKNCVLWCDWGKSMESWCGQKPTEIRNVRFEQNYVIHLHATAMNVTVWYGSEHSVVDGVSYENIFVDVDAENCQKLLETENGIEKREFVPRVVSVSIERLGRMVGLGTQVCEAVEDDTGFSVYFGHISYKNVRYFGVRRELSVVVEKYSDIHTVAHIGAEDCDFEIKGWD